MSDSLPINSDILVWARKELNLSIDDVARRMKKTPDIIKAWEAGSSSPTYVQLEKLAYEIYKIPLAVFFFSEPPNTTRTRSSFRTTPDVLFNMIPAAVIKVFREAEVMIENLYELSNGSDSPNQKSILKELQGNDYVNTAIALRKHLNVSITEQKSWRDSDLALNIWREKITESGLYIFRNPFKDAEYSGFCLYDERFPIIYLNSSTSKNRQIFTIFHEIWHLLSHTSGIDYLHDNRIINYLDKGSSDIETQCNRFAAEFLIPTQEFERNGLTFKVSEDTISSLAVEFSVSREVVLRRFLDYNKVSQSDYERLTIKWNEEMLSQKKSDTGGSYFNNEMSYLGDKYLRIAFDAYYKNHISSAQLADYLNIKEKSLPDYEAKYLGRAMA